MHTIRDTNGSDLVLHCGTQTTSVPNWPLIGAVCTKNGSRSYPGLVDLRRLFGRFAMSLFMKALKFVDVSRRDLAGSLLNPHIPSRHYGVCGHDDGTRGGATAA